jgi:hypothetical protein
MRITGFNEFIAPCGIIASRLNLIGRICSSEG